MLKSLNNVIFERKWLPETDESANYEYDIPLHSTPQPAVKMRKRDRAEKIRLAGEPKACLPKVGTGFGVKTCAKTKT
ncbi:hypothetical protein GCM10011491_06590 [Brucella endophytica]|uniref:Uncharacterized protein n=1 Tax=Brucella endophytica TaxID=1963359 RepID=A0A916S3P9_9HYPH|nr:hypothetical protein GCM10011491_06590 [Brucella endophytica]